MHAATEIPEEVRALARRRRGVVTWAELVRHGVGRHAVQRILARYCRVLPGVYCLDVPVHVRPDTLDLEVRAWAGLLYAGEGAVVAGRAAAYLFGLEDTAPALIQIAVPEARRVRDQPGFRFTRYRPGVLAQPLPRSMPVLRIEDVVLDLAGRGSDGYAIGLVTRACQRQLTTADRLLERLRGRSRHRRRALLMGLLEDAAGGTTSFLEHGYLTRVERAHGLPPTRRQHVVLETGHRSDGAYVDERVLLEHDGRAFHVEDAREADLALDAAHLAHGWVTVRTTYPMVFADACATARRVEDVRVARGGEPSLRRCPSCSRVADVAVHAACDRPVVEAHRRHRHRVGCGGMTGVVDDGAPEGDGSSCVRARHTSVSGLSRSGETV
ncbi:hypothetical protein [Arsenicicoccus bolidensis]|uniref:Transcriptional regulator, AbiEi antitoxin, Type IV TA system n=1 Tax=Arsenicicoccus bolidensis TaxID=229480 RepID=A0ABS9PYX0_9MICO|nr:hypothetical protein [Arsenicicoccus bolidensis]MCG7320834.1 hypothetical protein [Arsenicicoccus bolidensis]